MPSKPGVTHQLWIALRLLVFGCCGLFLMFGSEIAFIDRVFAGGNGVPSALLSLPLAVVGLFMTLYGVGHWGRWRYLLVFLSLGPTFTVCSFAANLLFPGGDSVTLPLILGITGGTAWLIHAAVRASYASRSAQPTPARPETDGSP